MQRIDHPRIAQQHGFTPVENASSGLFEGRRVSFGFSFTSNNAETFTVDAWLDPPLDLGLSMRERILAAVLEHDHVTGHPDLDGEFTITGDDPDRVRAFFAGPLRDDLAALYRASLDLRVHDAGCAIYAQTGFLGPDEAWFVRALRGAAAIAARMDEQRASLEAAHPIQPHAEVLRTLAKQRGLAFATTPLSTWGEVEGRAIQIGAQRTGRGKYELYARAALDGDLGIDLAIRRQGLLDGVRTLLGGQDVIVGDVPFDKRFLVRADPARTERIGLLLDAEARAALLAIDGRCGPVSVDDRGVAVGPIPIGHAPEDLVWLADTLTEVTGRVSRNIVHGGAEAGPYR
ncbi:MAG: hypothetical protein QM820_48685 [Minicystis sp.]